MTTQWEWELGCFWGGAGVRLLGAGLCGAHAAVCASARSVDSALQAVYTWARSVWAARAPREDPHILRRPSQSAEPECSFLVFGPAGRARRCGARCATLLPGLHGSMLSCLVSGALLQSNRTSVESGSVQTPLKQPAGGHLGPRARGRMGRPRAAREEGVGRCVGMEWWHAAAVWNPRDLAALMAHHQFP